MKVYVLAHDDVFKFPQFDYLDMAEKKSISERVKKNLSLLVSVVENEDVKLVSSLDFCKDRIHVSEVAGKSITKYIHGLEVFCFALAKKYKKEFVSFASSKDGIKWIGEKLGYTENQNGEFEKVVF